MTFIGIREAQPSVPTWMSELNPPARARAALGASSGRCYSYFVYNLNNTPSPSIKMIVLRRSVEITAESRHSLTVKMQAAAYQRNRPNAKRHIERPSTALRGDGGGRASCLAHRPGHGSFSVGSRSSTRFGWGVDLSMLPPLPSLYISVFSYFVPSPCAGATSRTGGAIGSSDRAPRHGPLLLPSLPGHRRLAL